jgi:hypothetical protein
LNLPAKTAYTLTYKATNPAEVWEGGVYFCSTRRLLTINAIACVLAALAVASKVSIGTFAATFLGFLIVSALFSFFTYLCFTLFHTVSLVFLSKLSVESTTVIDEDGIRESLGPVKTNYKWHQIRDVEMKRGSIYVIALVNGFHIPSSVLPAAKKQKKSLLLRNSTKQQRSKREIRSPPAVIYTAKIQSCCSSHCKTKKRPNGLKLKTTTKSRTANSAACHL